MAVQHVTGLSSSTRNPAFDGGVAPYYDTMKHWYDILCLVLHSQGVRPVTDVSHIHSDEGYDTMEYTGKKSGTIFFTWYRMTSGRLEIVCYDTDW
ncbi:MAG: hypothetical protein ACYS7Y_31300 [Planctomycetota bacterium]|jgi:hypothetical protein